MSSDRNTRRFFAVGIGIGLAVALTVYLRRLLESPEGERQLRAAQERLKLPIRIDGPAVIPPVRERPLSSEVAEPVVSEEPARLPLKVEASPHPFVRNQPGMIQARTLPGATCNIKAIYSTNRPPLSLETGEVEADENGHCEWTWDIRTGGDSVDVTVWVNSEGYEEAGLKITIPIVEDV